MIVSKRLLPAFVTSLLIPLPLIGQQELVTEGDSDSGLSLYDLRGDWLGIARFSDGSELRMGLEILRMADGSTGANVSFVDQGARYMPVSAISLAGRHFAFRMDGPGLSIEGELSADAMTIVGAGTQRGQSDSITFRRVADLRHSERQRPQTPQPPFPYQSEEVSFSNEADGVWLAGTLTLPVNDGPFAAAVFVAGAGANARDYDNSGHKLPMVIADYLTRRGIAVLRYDKRGVFRSTGVYAGATNDDFTRDAAAAYDYLATRSDIDAMRIGYIGHSAGSSAAVQATLMRDGAPAFVISLAGVGLPYLETLVLQDGTERAALGATEREIEVLQDFSRNFYQTAMSGRNEAERIELLRALYDSLEGEVRDIVDKWNGEYGRNTGSLEVGYASRDAFVDSLRASSEPEYWRQIAGPVLVLNGAKDSQVPAQEHVGAILRALEAGQATRFESRIFEGLNHMFQTSETGAVGEYSEIEETVAPQVLVHIGEWLQRTL